ncbi:hypothetical protein [Desulfomonile tiedjei]|uniref:hypothetical protein n=1 Tax=Desulfomonile tiedjei TaxID=2358 RepID=UPI0002DF92E2|nr:hypothetical protein [Desulfomonile tiedjei]
MFRIIMLLIVLSLAFPHIVMGEMQVSPAVADYRAEKTIVGETSQSAKSETASLIDNPDFIAGKKAPLYSGFSATGPTQRRIETYERRFQSNMRGLDNSIRDMNTNLNRMRTLQRRGL